MCATRNRCRRLPTTSYTSHTRHCGSEQLFIIWERRSNRASVCLSYFFGARLHVTRPTITRHAHTAHTYTKRGPTPTLPRRVSPRASPPSSAPHCSRPNSRVLWDLKSCRDLSTRGRGTRQGGRSAHGEGRLRGRRNAQGTAATFGMMAIGGVMIWQGNQDAAPFTNRKRFMLVTRGE